MSTICYGASVRLLNVHYKAQLTSECQNKKSGMRKLRAVLLVEHPGPQESESSEMSRKSGMQKLLTKVRMEHPDPQGSAGLWLVKGPHAPNTRMNSKYGTPVMNGDLMRLEHISTQHHLHAPGGDNPAIKNSPNNWSECDNWRIVVEEGEEWREGMRAMFIHDNTNNTLRICVTNKNLQINVTSSRESPSWWIGEVINPSWKVPFYTLEPLNHDLEVKPPFVVFGSAICLQHVETRRHLNSARDYEGVTHLSSSDQQQLSTVATISTNTVWVIKGRHKAGDRYNFTPKLVVRNGDVIRLEHYNTQTNLHSHTGHRSAISKQQEVTCFGHDGIGDGNDDFRVEVLGGETTWSVNSHIRLIHVNTNCALHSHSKPLDDRHNFEVTCYQKRDANDLWAVVFLELFF
eukprot:Phypoly_transcript_09564.p1 GENE.Phypoly_transcript_09564~~Phypoly_transcript_09564.p1  ORF type:complete len:403 (+),score=58.08 Phypoly_transcript_09564:156-1364(+)